MTSPSSSLSSYTTCTSSYSFSRNNSASTTTVSTSLSRSPVSMTPAETTQPAQTINGYDAAAYALTAGGTLVSTAVEYGASAGGAAIQGAGTLAGTGLGNDTHTHQMNAIFDWLECCIVFVSPCRPNHGVWIEVCVGKYGWNYRRQCCGLIHECSCIHGFLR